MANESLEERIKLLEKINERQKEINERHRHRIERIKAARACLNAIAKFEYYCEAGRWKDVVGLWSKKHPDVRSEIANWGVYEGNKGIQRVYDVVHRRATHDPGGASYLPGFCEIDIGTTHVVEVAADGQTARMLYISPGVVPSGWHWWKLGVDFVKEDGVWKLWHYHVYGLFGVPYFKSWVDSGRPHLLEVGPLRRVPLVPDELPDRPTTHPVWWYTKDTTTDPIPAPPEPYETFDEKIAY